MGNKMSAATDRIVPPELLVAELIGEVKDDDYFAKTTQTLHGMGEPPMEKAKSDYAITFEEAHTLTEPGLAMMENGFVRCKDGTWYIACHTDLGYEVNGAMIDWWFCNCDNTEKFKWWHPTAHISATWDPQYFSLMPHERPAGHYVEHTLIVEEKINDTVLSLQMEFVRPSKYFDTAKFKESGITACLVARLYSKDPVLGFVAMGHVVHTVREESGKSELRSRYWLGDINYPETPENLLVAGMVNYWANFSVSRIMKIPESTAKGMYVHCAQEMHCLKEFLPHYYEAMTSKDKSKSMSKIKASEKEEEVKDETKSDLQNGFSNPLKNAMNNPLARRR